MTTSNPPGSYDTSVLIAGGGPVGLALACELGLRGIDCMLVEKRDGKLHVPKMSLVSAGSMEYCRRWGISQQVRTAVWSESRPLDFVYMETLKGRELLRIKVPSYSAKAFDWTPEGMCQCPQIYFDPILAARVAGLQSVRCHYDTSLISFEQDADGVAVELAAADGIHRRRVRARYLVGCDGASSTVRDQLGIPLLGEGALANSINIFFRSPQLASMHDIGWARIYRPVDEEGCWSELIPIDGRELWRLTIFDDERYQHDPAAALRRMAGMDFPHEILSTLLWERRDSVAARYHDGRVLLAGDSAHQSSPTGGVGMHTGMEEAVNLAWKLDAVLSGWGGTGLLASYDAERRPIAQRNIDLSTLTYRALRAIPPASRADQETQWRTTALPSYSIPDHVRSCPVIAASPIVVEDGSPPLPVAPPQHIASTRPGARAPHAWLAPGRSTIDAFGADFVLVRTPAAARDGQLMLDAARHRGVPIRELVLEDEAIATLYEQPLVLVRPDFYVAWRSATAPADPLAILDRVRGA